MFASFHQSSRLGSCQEGKIVDGFNWMIPVIEHVSIDIQPSILLEKDVFPSLSPSARQV